MQTKTKQPTKYRDLLWIVILGYDSMGFEMSKPNLRSELEANLKL